MSLHFDRDFGNHLRELPPDEQSISSHCRQRDSLHSRRDRVYVSARLLRERLITKLKDATTIKNIANISFILVISFICLQQCYTQVAEYLRYSIKIQVSHIFPSSPLWLLPGVTICSNNRIRLSKLIQENSELGEKIEDLVDGINMTEEMLVSRKRFDLLKNIKKITDDYFNTTDLLAESSMDKLIDLADLDGIRMIKDINCNGLWGKQFNCENFRLVKSFQAGPCNTMFHMGSLLEALASGKAYDFSTSMLNGGKKNDSFADHEVAEILVDFEPHHHGDFHRDVGGQLVIHSTGHIGSLRDMAYSLMPGHKYDIIVQRSMTKRLPPPYVSQCYDYKMEYSKRFVQGGAFPSVPLDKTTCTRNCIVKLLTKSCNCWPVEVPFYPDDDLVEDSGSYRLCAWGFQGAMRNYSAALYIDCYRRTHEACRSMCKHGCRTEDYTVSVITNSWPSKDQFFLAKTDSDRMRLQTYEGCCALVSIKYLEFMENRHLMYPSMTSAQLFSNIGGIVSALVGVSGVTVYRYLTRRVFRCKVVRDYKPKDNKLTPLVLANLQKARQSSV